MVFVFKSALSEANWENELSTTLHSGQYKHEFKKIVTWLHEAENLMLDKMSMRFLEPSFL